MSNKEEKSKEHKKKNKYNFISLLRKTVGYIKYSI